MARIDSLGAPLLVTWQLTRDCDLACLHCCTDSAPGKRLKDELDAGEALRVAGEIAGAHVPYVMLAGGEPMVSPHFFEVARLLGDAGVELKIETNGQRLDAEAVARLAALLALPFVATSANAAFSTYMRPKAFLPAMRSMVVAYLVVTGLFTAAVFAQGL